MADSPMTVGFDTTADHDFVCLGISINDRERLCKILVEVALGKSRHAVKILSDNAEFESTSLKSMAVASASNLFQRQKDDKPFHRDGWMFQVISWIASQVSYPNAIHKLPHMRHAHKGLDGLCVAIDDQNSNIAYCVISEDKATIDPRGTFKEDVIPELTRFESGIETTLLTDGVISLLANSDIEDVDDAVEKILWNESMRYRVSTTTATSYHQTSLGKAGIFKGFSAAIPGDDERRIGVLMHDANMRETFDKISARCLEILQERAEFSV